MASRNLCVCVCNMLWQNTIMVADILIFPLQDGYVILWHLASFSFRKLQFTFYFREDQIKTLIVIENHGIG